MYKLALITRQADECDIVTGCSDFFSTLSYFHCKCTVSDTSGQPLHFIMSVTAIYMTESVVEVKHKILIIASMCILVPRPCRGREEHRPHAWPGMTL